MATVESIRLTDDMLPAIKANVLGKRVWLAALSLAAWGALTLAIWGANFTDETVRKVSAISVPLWILFNGAGILGAVMLLLAAYGFIARDPRVMLMDALTVGAVGIWSVVASFLLSPALAQHGYQAEGQDGLVVGCVQVLWAYREYRKRLAVAKWQSETLAVAPEVKAAVAVTMKNFAKCDEGFVEGRIQATVGDKDFLAHGRSKVYRGQLLETRAIMVSRSRDDCLIVNRADARLLPYKRGMTKVQTEQGLKQFTFGPASVLAWKLWAGASVLEEDIRNLARRKKANLAILSVFLAGEDAGLKLASLAALKRVRGDGEVPAAAGQLLGDADSRVRRAALEFLADAKAGGLGARVMPMLKDPAAEVRMAAASYFSALPDPSAANALRQAAQVETDGKADKRLRKALTACDADTRNPFSRRA